jgi:hypothetical protein
LGEITGTVDDANRLHAVFDQPIKGYPTFYNECPRALANLRAGGAELWMFLQQVSVLFDAVIDLVGQVGIPRLDVEPDVHKVFVRAACKTNAAHALIL